MRKLQILIVALLSTTMAFAQPSKGDIYLGGNLNLDFGSSKNTTGGTTTKGPKTFNFTLMPRAGYFVTNKILVGLDLGIGISGSKLENSGVTTKSSGINYGGGVFARYYVMPAERFAIFFEGGVNTMFGSSKVKVGSVSSDGPKTFALNAGFTPGIAVYVSKKIALEASYGFLGYSAYSEKQDIAGTKVKDSSGNFNLNVNPNTFKFGVSVLF